MYIYKVEYGDIKLKNITIEADGCENQGDGEFYFYLNKIEESKKRFSRKNRTKKIRIPHAVIRNVQSIVVEGNK